VLGVTVLVSDRTGEELGFEKVVAVVVPIVVPITVEELGFKGLVVEVAITAVVFASL